MVKFKSEGHLYSTLDGKELTSVSAFMHGFEPFINWGEKAKRKSASLKKNEGIIKSPTELLEEWKMKREKGSEAGTIVHSIKEQELLATQGIKIVESRTDKDFKYALDVKALEDNTTYPELLIYDLDFGICGQADEVTIKKGVITVVDYKTDKSIERKGYSSQWQPAEKLLSPLSHLDDCNFNKYSIKMSLYMYLIWKAGKGKFKPGKLLLKWCPIQRDEDGIPILYEGIPKILKEEIIEVPYRKKEVIDMLKTIK